MSTEQLTPTSQALDSNPLETADTKSLDELFDEDPEKLTEADLSRIVERLRKARATFAASEAAGKKGKVQGETGKQLSLEDLGF